MLILLGFSTFSQVRINGTVYDEQTNEILQYAHVGVINTALGTVTNINGEFSLLVPEKYINKELVASFIGYENRKLSISSAAEFTSLKILLKPSPIELNTVTIKRKEKSIVAEAVELIPQNHDLNNMVLTGFWRGTMSNNDTVIQLSETVFDIYRHGESEKKKNDLMIRKGRISRDSSAFVDLFNIQAGVEPSTIFAVSFLTDLKIFSKKVMKNHTFKITDVTTYNDRPVYVVEFDKIDEYEKNGYAGKILLDTETLAFVQVTYHYSPGNSEEVPLFSKGNLSRALRDLKASTREEQVTELNFQMVDDKWYLSHSIHTGNWTLKLRDSDFNEPLAYTANFVVTDINTGEFSLPDKRKLARNTILERQGSYQTGDFWEDYNVLKPDEKFEKLFAEINQRNKDAREAEQEVSE